MFSRSITVVGFGPVGQFSALAMARAGHRVTVLRDPNCPAAGLAAGALVSPLGCSGALAEMMVGASMRAWEEIPRTEPSLIGVRQHALHSRHELDGIWDQFRNGSGANGSAARIATVVTPHVFSRSMEDLLTRLGVTVLDSRVNDLGQAATDTEADALIVAAGVGAFALGDRRVRAEQAQIALAEQPHRCSFAAVDAVRRTYVVPQHGGWLAIGETCSPLPGPPAAHAPLLEARPGPLVGTSLRGEARRLHASLGGASLPIAEVRSARRALLPGGPEIRVTDEGVPTVWATGFGGAGWTLAPAASGVIADRIEREVGIAIAA